MNWLYFFDVEDEDDFTAEELVEVLNQGYWEYLSDKHRDELNSLDTAELGDHEVWLESNV